MMSQTLGLLVLLPLILAVDIERLERIRLLHDHDGIDTATVHISYPYSSSCLRRLTKREAVENLLPRRHDNLTVKVTLSSTGRVLDLHLQPSNLQIHGALVKVMTQEGQEEEFRVEDEGCHYQGVLDKGEGVASVHFCDGVLVGGAHTKEIEYHFHSHKHRLPQDDNSSNPDNPLRLLSHSDRDLYHTVVSWTSASGDFSFDNKDDPFVLTHDYVVINNEEEEVVEEKRRAKRQAVPTTTPSDEEGDMAYDDTIDHSRIAPSDPKDELPNTEYHDSKVPIVEFGIIVDEEFLQDRKFLYPTRQDIIRMLMVKYTGVQGLYGNPELTGIHMIIQVKLVYLWEKNPAYYNGSQLSMGGRMVAGRKLSQEDPLFAGVDVGAVFTSRSPTNVVGMAFLGGACLKGAKTYVTRKHTLTWNTEAHELGHTLGMNHSPETCVDAKPPYHRGFMNSVSNMFLPCYGQFLRTRLQTNKLKCLYTTGVNTTNIPPLRLQATFPVLAFGLNYYCQTEFRNDSTFAFQDSSKRCGDVVCSVTDQENSEYGMSQVSPAFPGMRCGNKGEICFHKECKAPSGHTTIHVHDTVTGSSTWLPWTPYASRCTSACGAGVQISSRECRNRERAEACVGPSHRARLCNLQPCPGDDLKEELEIREDRANYMCSLLLARGGNLTQHLRPHAEKASRKQLWEPISVGSCLVSCGLVSRPKDSPSMQRKGFGTILQADGTVCGPPNTFDRTVLNITTRCLRGRCLEFGCDEYSMENRDGKLLDMCGVCGGDNSSCNAGQTAVHFAQGEVSKLLAELPAGTTDILFALKPDSPGSVQDRHIRLALTDKDDSDVIMPGPRGRRRLRRGSNTDNPLNYAGTHWTTLDGKIIFAPGPTDQPMRISVMVTGGGSPVEVLIVYGYKLPHTVPRPPQCENGGVADTTNGGCRCTGKYHGRQCEYGCHNICFNGGQLLQRRCRCDCSSNPRTLQDRSCSCLEGFAGPDCSQCVIRHCYNGGTRNNATCQCQCPPECQSQPDCSDCNYNPLLLHYRGQYGRGSLEDPLQPNKTMAMTQTNKNIEHPVETTTTQRGDTSSQSTIGKGQGNRLPQILGKPGERRRNDDRKKGRKNQGRNKGRKKSEDRGRKSGGDNDQDKGRNNERKCKRRQKKQGLC